MSWYFQVLKSYAAFSGRARRKEYWMFLLVNIVIFFVLGFVEGMIGMPGAGTGMLVLLYQLFIIIPSIAVGVRRMHDTDHSGWWLLFPLVNLLFALTEGQPNSNRFGPDPKAGAR